MAPRRSRDADKQTKSDPQIAPEPTARTAGAPLADDEADVDLLEEEGVGTIAVETDKDGERLDAALARLLPDLSRSRLKALIKDGDVTLDGAAVTDPSRKTRVGERVTVLLPPPVDADPEPEAIPLTILYEDEHLIVIDKPAGLVVHPAAGNWTGTLVNALLHHCADSLSGIGGVRRPGIVHRLDKETSGVMVVAKTDVAHQGLAAQFADHGRTGDLERAYLALVWGAPEPFRGTIDAPLGRSNSDRTKMAVTKSGKEAITHYEVTERFPEGSGREAVASLVECRLETGRTHQIRVHMAEIGHPLIGDPVYGRGFRTKANRLPPDLGEAVRAFPRQALHAFLIAFAHPVNGEILRFESPLPQDMRELISNFHSC
ncbi:Ribosomal large subunit pseudouridine synthase D [Hartmannibacter diazotrophicus]|uniref:Pseudouridine synthase n=1 Tax=Hartmannibacter diazotrophicus TaxID=1482074 RepID=A0A2C9DAD5_9HYPH|nr:RluA family pseudouridine synthase [Hartmannibacter diazotrophicus]SON57120.1 Ribosomal large subunit pseudouridine synthase D [Hartmannibacter diazotrophicus]